MDPPSQVEDGNPTFNAFQQDLQHESTPKKPKKKATKNLDYKFLCGTCGKGYMVNHYYQLHLKSHTDQPHATGLKRPHGDDVDETLNDTQPIDLSVHDLTLSQLNTSVAAPTFRAPGPPPKKKKANKNKPTLICTYCLKPYVCSRSFYSHNRMHVMQDAARRMPDTQKILDNVEQISSKSLTEVSNCISHGSQGRKFKELMGHLVTHQKFVDFSSSVAKEILICIEGQKVVLPSALMVNLYDRMEVILSDNNLCFDLLSVLDLSDFEADTQSQFLLEFMMSFTLEIFRFISASIRSGHTPKAAQVVELDLEERQVIFYIGASIMRGYLRIAKRFSNSQKWQNIASVLKSKVLCEKPVGDIEAQWTADVDRGGLLYITTPTQKFFKQVATIVYSSEQKDGSINYEEVITKVTNTDMSVTWDNIISDSLNEKVSLNLMNDVITCFCKTCGRGIAKRRLNKLRQKNPLISMATRVSVARRKKK